jgi:fused signal recognition particle receptor
LLVAAVTFRAAAIEQLEVWGGRIGLDVIRHQQWADPSAVVFDGLAAAKARGAGVVLIDTAGRLHTKANLMDELRKIKRVLARELPGAPHEVLLVVDATVGQNSLSQARQFHEAVGVTGIVLTKLDGTARGGIVVAIAEELKIPVRLIGVGEKVEDLQDFHAHEFVEALFEKT